MTKNNIYQLLRNLVKDLSEKKYDYIVKSGRNGNLDVKLIEKLIQEYPGNITVPPEEAFQELDFVEYDDSPGEGEIDFDLWYDHKKSDLTLISEIFKDSEGKLNIRIYDIHVM